MATKTLTEAGGRTEVVLPTSQDIQSGTSQITPTQTTPKVGDSLSRDLLSLMGKGSQVMQEKNTLSVKAAQRVAEDSLTQMAIDIEEYKSTITPDANTDEVVETYESIYQEYGRKTFDNEDAQRAFDDVYHKKGALATAQNTRQAIQVGMKRDHEALVASEQTSMANQLDAGIMQDADSINQFRERVTAGGYKDMAQADNLASDILITGMNRKYKTNKNLKIYTNGTIDSKLQDREFNRMFGGMARMENGEITKVGDTTDAAVQKIQSAWNTLKNKDKESKRPYNLAWQIVENNLSGTLSQGANGKMLSSDLKIIRDQLKGSATKAIDLGQSGQVSEVSSNEYGMYSANMIKLNNMIDISERVESDVNDRTIKDDDLMTWLDKGKSINIDDGKGNTITKHILADHYRNAVRREIDTKSEELYQLDLSTPEGVRDFNVRMNNIKRLEQLSGMQSKFTRQYEDVFDPNKQGATLSIDDIHRAKALATNYGATSNTYAQYQPLIQELNTEIEKGKKLKLTDSELTIRLNTMVNASKSDQQAKQIDDNYQTAIDDAVTEIKNGGAAYTEIINMEMPENTNKALLDYARHLGVDAIILKERLLGMETYNHGAMFFGRDRVRTPIPIGLTDSDYKKHLDNLFTAHKNKFNSDYDEGDTHPYLRFNKTTGNFEVEIRAVKDMWKHAEILGRISVKGHILSSAERENK